MPIDTAPPDRTAPDLPSLKPGGTFFAPPERLEFEQVEAQLRQISGHPLLQTLLNTVGGLLAVLNEHRQILAVNEALLAHLGVGSAESVLGLRLGEALQCPHSREMVGGCGTSRFCSTCGAAIAQAVALNHQKCTERFCALETVHDGVSDNLYLRVRASPLEINQHPMILVFIDDFTRQQQTALAERSFHHDLNNTLTCLLHASETLVEDTHGEIAGQAGEVHRLTTRVVRELDLQRRLVTSSFEELALVTGTVRLSACLDELRGMIGNHPTAAGKRTIITQPQEDFDFITDSTLLLRVLGNMALNALEATRAGGEVRIHAEVTSARLIFRVWSEPPIPPEVALRVFQRNFSTKGGLGRGLGTYSMKLVGERLLGGKVTFESSALEGTTFQFALPL